MKEGRRTSSLKASYEAIKNNDFQLGREFSLTSRDTTGAYSTSALANTLTQTLTPAGSAVASDSRGGRKTKYDNLHAHTHNLHVHTQPPYAQTSMTSPS